MALGTICVHDDGVILKSWGMGRRLVNGQRATGNTKSNDWQILNFSYNQSSCQLRCSGLGTFKQYYRSRNTGCPAGSDSIRDWGLSTADRDKILS